MSSLFLLQQNLARNFSKSRGIDISLLRRIREEKQCQVRKEKRNFKTNMERRKVSPSKYRHLDIYI